MRLLEIAAQPESKLDLDNKVYIVYDENGNEHSRYTFQHVWDSSPARDAAANDVRELKIRLRAVRSDQLAKAAEAKPLSNFEKEYLDINNKWQKYFNILHPRDKSPTGIDQETTLLYIEQMDKWMKRLEMLNSNVRTSVVLGTYKPPA